MLQGSTVGDPPYPSAHVTARLKSVGVYISPVTVSYPVVSNGATHSNSVQPASVYS